MSVIAERPLKPQLGEIVEAETLVAYLEYRHRRGTLNPHSDRITVHTGLAEERFDLVREEQVVQLAADAVTSAALAALEEAQRCLLRYQLEVLASPKCEPKGDNPVTARLDRLEHERDLRSAIDLYASLKDSEHTAGARDPPVP